MGLGAAMKGLGQGLWASNTARSGIIGAAAGGVYGGFSDNWSVLGGAAAGASIGIANVGRNKFSRAMATRQLGLGARRNQTNINPLNVGKGLAANAGYMGSLVGGMVGGAYGMFSDDTSILGGAMAGSAMGAGIGKFGVKPFMQRKNANGFGNAFKNEVSSAIRGVKLKANKAGNRIKGLSNKFKTDLAL
jgi:hypothetical protein